MCKRPITLKVNCCLPCLFSSEITVHTQFCKMLSSESQDINLVVWKKNKTVVPIHSPGVTLPFFVN